MQDKTKDIIEVRKAHRIDEKKLQSFLDQNSEYQSWSQRQTKGDDLSFKMKQFNHGQSSPTYLIQYNGVKFVLRKKPHGKLLPGAHAVDREYRIQKTLFSQQFPVPEPVVLCTDTSVLGQAFYIMQYVEGRIFTNNNLPGISPDEREQVYTEMVRVLALLHSLDYQALGMGNYAKGTKGFYERITRTWTQAYQMAETEPIKQMDHLIQWLPKNIPKGSQYHKTTLVHGDYRIDNVVFHKTELKIIAVLDWELSTLGNPLSDLATLSQLYHTPANTPNMRGVGNFDKDMSGIPTEFQLRDAYLAKSNANYQIEEEDWNFLLSQGFFKMASICQGVYKRSLLGNASSTHGSKMLVATKQLANLSFRISQNNFPYRLRPTEYSLLTYSEHFKKIRAKLLFFMERHILGKQRAFLKAIDSEQNRWQHHSAIMQDLKTKAKQEGLWNLFLPSVSGLSQLEYAQLCEIMGKSLLAPEAFNCSAPDTGNMETIHLFGTAAQKKQWLEPLLRGEIRSMFGMTEPAVGSSDATNMSTLVEKTACGRYYRVNGRKWWSSGAGDPRCKVAIVMGVTPNAMKKKHQQHSMILVPMETAGVKIVRPLTVMGYDDAPHGHMEVAFTDVLVPVENMLLGEGRGFEIAQGRLGPGRIHHCMRLIGYAEQALVLMCDRAVKRETFGKPLINHQKIQMDIAQSRLEIEQARLLVLRCADEIDKRGTKNARSEIAMIKVVAPQMACRVIDRAIQAYGGAGVSTDTILAYLYALSRTLRIADGPDEVHMLTITKSEMVKQIQTPRL